MRCGDVGKVRRYNEVKVYQRLDQHRGKGKEDIDKRDNPKTGLEICLMPRIRRIYEFSSVCHVLVS